MTTVDTNRLRGNYAQAVASAWLSRGCLVRPVSEGTDIGIDLYCEAVLEGSPYLHFWVQVKSIAVATVGVQGGKPTATYSFDRKHLEYWDRQPIPVYAFLVPLGTWPPTEPDSIFGVRITERLVKEGLPSAASVSYRTSDSFDRETVDEDIRQFVTKVVPWDTSALLLKRGIVAPLPKARKEPSDEQFPTGIGFQYLPRVLTTMRDAAVHGLYHSLLAEHYDPSWQETRKRFHGAAEYFEKDMHKYGLSMLVRSAHADGDIEKAKGYVHRALERIAIDSTLSEEERSSLSAEVRVLLEDFETTGDGDRTR